MRRNTSLANFAWMVLVVNVLVILWGAYVRATGSGAGCGNHWPLCNGVVLPRAGETETWVEFSHRLSSGLALILVAVLTLWTRKSYPRGHRVRQAGFYSLVFVVLEALIGAGLVLFDLVAENQSLMRSISTPAHLVNTFLLLGAITLTAWWSAGNASVQLGNKPSTWLLGGGLFGVILVGASGALIALGDTLFPVASLAEGLAQDFDPQAHFLVRLRTVHPLLAIGSALLLGISSRYFSQRILRQPIQTFAERLLLLLGIQLAAGVLNVFLLAPVWLQMVHLLLADLVWIVFVLFSAAVLKVPDVRSDHPNQAALEQDSQ
jgi:heme a synthase